MIEFIQTLTMATILPAVILLVIGVLAIRVLMKLVDKSLSKSKLEKAATSLIRSLLKVVLYVLLGLMVASKLGIDVTGIVALASVASLALSLSLQDALSNVIGGFTLLSNHPFHSGDFVEIAGQAGTVQTIDITYTKLTTGDNKTISIPNSAVVASQIVNYSTSGTRRVEINVSASYDAPIAVVKAALLAAKESCDLPIIVSNAYGEDEKLMTGATPEAVVSLLEGYVEYRNTLLIGFCRIRATRPAIINGATIQNAYFRNSA